MPGPTNTELIREHERQIITLNGLLDTLKRDLIRNEEKVEDIARTVQNLDKSSPLLAEKLDRLGAKVDEITLRRWEILKIVISAIVGASLAVAGFYAKAVIDRATGVVPASSDRK